MKSVNRDAVFAMEFDEQAPPIVQEVYALYWSVDALRVFKQVRDEAINNEKARSENGFINLPYANLRAHLQVGIDDWVEIKDDVGLYSLYESSRAPEAWGFLSNIDHDSTLQRIHDAIFRWSEGALARFCDARSAHTLGISTLRNLGRENKLIRLKPTSIQLHPWSMSFKSGEPTPFHVTAGIIASHLAGIEIFPELGPVVRAADSAQHNLSEIMTRPISAAGGRFSLACEISVETLPGALRPLVFFRFKRRRWATSLNDKYSKYSSIGGFVFPHALRPKRAYRFSVMRRNGEWKTDLAFPQYEHAFNLMTDFQDARVVTYPCDENASVAVMVKADLAIDDEADLLAGVPLVDQADAFNEISAALTSLGLKPFTDFHACKTTALKATPLRVLKAEVVLAKLFERSGIDDMEDTPVDTAIKNSTNWPIERWFKSGHAVPEKEHARIVSAVRVLVAETAYMDDETRKTLFLVSSASDDIEWIKTTIHAMLGDEINVLSVRLPANTHGPRQHLPEHDRSPQQRFDARVREWLTFAEAINLPARAMVLIQAPLFYDVGGSGVKPDDHINKLAARKTLASRGCTVQYLLPSEGGKLDKFLLRLQAAVLDLVFGHAGSVWGLKRASKSCFDDVKFTPRWVSALSSLQVRTEWGKTQSVLVSTKIDCHSGCAWVRFGHQAAEAIVTPWMRFDEGAKYLSTRRVELPRLNTEQRKLFAAFTSRCFDDLVLHDPNAVVFIDATRMARLASWLTDREMRNDQYLISPETIVSERWPMLRLIRIREQAPTIGQERMFAPASKSDKSIRTWTSTQRLFQVERATKAVFWSLAKPSTHHKRGASCYREMLLPKSSKTAASSESIAVFPAQPDTQHLNPRALEIVILQKQATDSDVQLASFAQQLRAGMLTARIDRWVTTPSPLRIIEKFAEYMKA